MKKFIAIILTAIALTNLVGCNTTRQSVDYEELYTIISTWNESQNSN